MPQNPDKEKWNEFDWELELRKDDARVNTYANDLPKFIDLPDEDGVIMNRMKKRPELAPAGGDWSKLGPVPYDSGGEESDEEEEPPPENDVDWRTAPGAVVYSESARMARDWAAYYACSRTSALLVPTMKVLCLYGKLMARSGDIIDMSLEEEESAAQSRPLKIALCKRLLSDVNLLMGHFMKIHRDFPEHAAKCQEHESVLGQLHDNLLDVMGELRKQ